MTKASHILGNVNRVITYLVQNGLADDQRFASFGRQVEGREGVL